MYHPDVTDGVVLDLKIRGAEPSDTPEIKGLIISILEQEFHASMEFYGGTDLDDIPSNYSGAREAFYVAELNGRIVGTCGIKEDDAHTAMLRRVFLHPAHRKKGYGAILLGKAVDFCREQGYRTITFRGTSEMASAIQLCRRASFREREVLKIGALQVVILAKDIASTGNSARPVAARS